MVAPDEVRRIRMELGIKLAAAREAAGLTQKQLGQATNYVRSSIANVETGRQNVPRGFWATCDELLGTSPALVDAHDRLEDLMGQRRRRSAQSTAQRKLAGLAMPRSAGQRPSTPVPLPAPISRERARRDHLMLTPNLRARELYLRGHGMLHGNRRHEIEIAQTLLDRAVGHDPRLALAIADRGYARWRQYFAGWADSPNNAITGALCDVEAALAVDPTSVPAYNTFIRACWDMGWHQRALDAGRVIYLQHPESLDATIAYARALMNAGMAELALPLASTVLREDPTHPAATKLVIWCRLLLGHHELAVTTAGPYLAVHQGDANTRWAVALASASVPSGLDHAMRVAVDAIEADPVDMTIWLLLGYLHRRRGDEQAARESWLQGLDQVRRHHLGLNPRTAAWAANIHAALKEREATLDIVSCLADNDADNGYIRYRLFHSLAELGETHSAAAMLDSAVSAGFLSVQLMRQEEALAPRHIRACEPYLQVARRLEGIVEAVRYEHEEQARR